MKSNITYIESNDFLNQFEISHKIESIKDTSSSYVSFVKIIPLKSTELNEYFQERQKIIEKFNNFLTKNLKTDANLSLNSFKFLRQLGKGGYGSVFLVYSQNTNEYLALKAMKKSTLIETNEQNIIISERQYAFALNHPNIVDYRTSFQDNEYIYLAFEWLQGGDLYSLINYQKLTELQAKFYAAQIILALDYLHGCKIVFRDLKPENIVFTQHGYIKLVDLGLAKLIRGYTQTFCGTPHYIAPEIIMRQPYTISPDYWSLGIIIHEMITGDAPYDRTYRFDSNTNDGSELTNSTIENDITDTIRSSSKHYNMYLRIIHGCSSLKLENVTKNCALLIRNLLEHNIEQRLGCGIRGALDLIEHPWFNQINFWNLYQQKYLAPFLPIRKYLIKDNNYQKNILQFTAKNLYENKFIDF